MIHYNALAQIIGFVALFVSILIFQINNRRKMLTVGAVSALFWTLHFYLLGAPTGAAMNAVGAVRDVTLSRTKPARKNLWILGSIMLLASAATALTWQGLISLLPLVACALNGLSFWNSNTRRIRRVYLLVPVLWFSYNFYVHSYPGMIVECLMIVSNIIAQLRFDRKIMYKRSSDTALQKI